MTTTAKEIAEGVAGAGGMLLTLLTPMLRGPRSHWGATAEDMRGPYPGDEIVPAPRWMWHHAVTIEAPAEDVWPWVRQVGVGKAGFYSYEALENLAGCDIDNAEAIHPEWAVRPGEALHLHPKMPGMPIRWIEEGRGFVAGARSDADTRAELSLDAPLPPRYVAVSWAFLLEPLGDARCRFVSRFRTSYPDGILERLSMGPTLTEPIGFVMDRRMLLTVKRLAERDARGERGPVEIPREPDLR